MSEKIPENMPDNCKASFWDSKVPFLATFLLDRKQLVWDLALFYVGNLLYVQIMSFDPN